MGQRTIVYGYIAVDPDFANENLGVLRSFPFDSSYPFPNIFSEIRAGYESSTISFAGSFKSLTEDWDEWEGKFESLLSRLYSRMASVQLEDELDGTVKNIRYLCNSGWEKEVPPALRSWSKWYRNRDGTASEEIGLSPVK